VKVAIIGITAGGVGLDFSSAQNVIFAELPKSASALLQVLSLFLSVCCCNFFSTITECSQSGGTIFGYFHSYSGRIRIEMPM
jgi:hypothetical protein